MPTAPDLSAPSVIIHNDETLWVEMRDPNTSSKLSITNPTDYADLYESLKRQLSLTGETSGYKRTVTVTYDATLTTAFYDVYTAVLDDITVETLRFKTQFCSEDSDSPNKNLIPGENISVVAMVSGGLVYTADVTSKAETTNSLYAGGSAPCNMDGNGTANIAKFRHLENLDGSKSGYGYWPERSTPFTHLTATQTENLNWSSIGTYGRFAGTFTYAPVDPVYQIGENSPEPYDLVYSGLYNETIKSISNVVINVSGNAGIFGTLTGDLVSDLKLADLKVTGTNAGALAGVATKSSIAGSESTVVRNVVAYGSDVFGTNSGVTTGAWKESIGYSGLYPSLWVQGIIKGVRSITITPDSGWKSYICGSGSVGGLVGSLEKGSEVDFCAAALYVRSSDGDAGGLVGATSGYAEIRASYAGGHTQNAEYGSDWNVMADGSAGGLVGNVGEGGLYVECSYTTCSAKGTNAGGFIGTVGSATTLDTVYCTGKVSGTTKQDPFIAVGGSDTNLTMVSKNYYILSTNDLGNVVTSAVTNSRLIAIMADQWEEYDDLIRPVSDRKTAESYDGTLRQKYVQKYYFPTVQQLYDNRTAYYAGSDTVPQTYGQSVTDCFNLTRSSTIPPIVAAQQHYGDWSVPLLKPMDYFWVNGDTLTLKINFTNYANYNKDVGPKTIMVAVSGETSGATRVYKLTRVDSGSSYHYVIEDEAGKVGTVAPLTNGAINAAGSVTWDTDGNRLARPALATNSFAKESGTKELVLTFDDITGTGTQFKDIMGTGTQALTPGENITARVDTAQTWSEIYGDWGSLAPAIKANTTTNSLFAYDEERDPLNASNKKAKITSIRHLENLDGSISRYVPGGDSVGTTPVTATQTENLSWSEFKANVADPNYDYLPVNTAYTLTYEGGTYQETVGTETVTKLRSISGVVINPVNPGSEMGYAGIFGSLTAGESVTGLELSEISVNARTDGNVTAGALAGSAEGAKIKGVLVTGSKQITGTGTGAAGGLIGSLTGGSITGDNVSECAAAVYVRTVSGAAGGLIGSASGGAKVSGCYSGGHTDDSGKYKKTFSGSDRWNVISGTLTDSGFTPGGAAGGLIGSATGSIEVEYSYSTCSAYGSTVGGLVGKAESGSIKHTYATGLVGGTTAGAFAGEFTGTVTCEDCAYYEIINEEAVNGDPEKGYEYLKAVGASSGSSDHTGIAALDGEVMRNDFTTSAAVTSYEGFVNGNTSTFNLKTVAALGKPDCTYTDITGVHYGDWPRPETWAENKNS